MSRAPKLPPDGSRVGTVCGPGENPRHNAGTVLATVTDRWGTHVVVLMDDMSVTTCHGLTTIGIGWYLLPDELRDVPHTARG